MPIRPGFFLSLALFFFLCVDSNLRQIFHLVYKKSSENSQSYELPEVPGRLTELVPVGPHGHASTHLPGQRMCYFNWLRTRLNVSSLSVVCRQFYPEAEGRDCDFPEENQDFVTRRSKIEKLCGKNHGHPLPCPLRLSGNALIFWNSPVIPSPLFQLSSKHIPASHGPGNQWLTCLCPAASSFFKQDFVFVSTIYKHSAWYKGRAQCMLNKYLQICALATLFLSKE